MKSVFKIAVKGIFKRKTYTVAIFFLTIIAAVCMVTALGTLTRTKDIYNAAYEKSSSPDIFYFYEGSTYKPEFTEFFKNRSEVKKASAQTSLAQISNVFSLNGSELTDCVLEPYNPQVYDFNISTPKKDKKLLDNEVYVPIIYQSQFHAKIGDQFIISTTEGKKSFTIAGYLEDPIFGSAFMDMKRTLFSEKSYKEIERLTADKTTTYVTLMNIQLKDSYQGSALEKTTNTLNKAFGKDTAAQFYSNKNFYSSAVLSIPRIISVVLLCFSVLLIVIVLIVIRHAILSSIEADYVSLGVLKAVGFTGKNIIASILLQYLMISGAGTAVGVIAGIFTTPFIGKILLNSTGIFWSGNVTVPIALLVILAILAVIVSISYFTARKAAKISPVRAISFGKAPVHFSSKLNVPLARLNFLPLSVKMAVKQMMTKLKQYSTLIGITAIFTFMIITITTLVGNFSTTGNVYKLFGLDNYDINISSNATTCPPEKLDQIVKDIDKTYGIKSTSTTAYGQIKIDDISVSGKIRGDFNLMKDSLIEGKLPQFDNEVAITPLMSEALGKGVGDTVEISGKNGIKCNYLITCKIQCISEMGKVIFMPVSAYKRIVPDFKPLSRTVTLKQSSNIDAIVDKMKEQYKASENGISITNAKANNDKMITTVQSSISVASTIVFSLTFVLIACITILLCSITIYRETIDTGIFKAIGFKAMDLRLQFTLRFMLIAILGGIIGTAFGLLFDEKLIHVMLSSVGIANLKPVWDFSSIGIPILFIVCVTGITAFFCSAKNNKISPSNLISE